MTSNYLSKEDWRKWRTRLTRATNSKDPLKVLAVCKDWNTFMQDNDYVYPDDWARFQRAEDDAKMDLRYAGRN